MYFLIKTAGASDGESTILSTVFDKKHYILSSILDKNHHFLSSIFDKNNLVCILLKKSSKKNEIDSAICEMCAIILMPMKSTRETSSMTVQQPV